MSTLPARSIEASELDLLARCVDQLPVGSPLGRALEDLVAAVREGVDVMVAPIDGEITPNQAALALRVSRPHLYKLLDAGLIPHHRVGQHRRIRVEDLTVFLQRREARRREFAESVANIDGARREVTAQLAGVDEDTARRLGY